MEGDGVAAEEEDDDVEEDLDIVSLGRREGDSRCLCSVSSFDR